MNIYDLADTWNAGGTIFDAIRMDVTNTASDAESNLLWLGIGGANLIRFRRDGALIFTNGLLETSSKTLVKAPPLVNYTGAFDFLMQLGTAPNSGAGDGSYDTTFAWGFDDPSSTKSFKFVMESDFRPSPGQVNREAYIEVFLANGDNYRPWGVTFVQGATLAASTGTFSGKATEYDFATLSGAQVLTLVETQLTTQFWRFAYSSGDQSVALEPQGLVESNSGPLHLISWQQINLPSLLKMPDTGVIFGPTNNAGSWSISGGGSNAGAVTVYGESAGGGLAGVTKITGSGVLWYGTHSALAAETVTGYITIKDAAGNSRKLAVVS